MKKLSSIFVSAVATIMCGSIAHAYDGEESATGMFLEPGLSYQMMTSNINYPAPYANSSAVDRGFGVLLRGGVHLFDQFFVAADARYALLQYEDNANGLSSSASSWDIAPVVGYQMRDYGLRIFGGYILAGNLDPAAANGLNYRFDNPTGWRIGAGLKLKMFSINIEWQKVSYGTTKIESAGPIAANADMGKIKYDGSGVVASITFPIEFH